MTLPRSNDGQKQASSAFGLLTPDDCAACPLATAVLCQKLRTTEAVGQTAPRLRSVPRDTVLVNESEIPNFTGVLRKGLARITRHAEDGYRKILALNQMGDLIGDWPGRPSGLTLEAATDVEICTFDRRLVSRILDKDPSARMFILREFDTQNYRQLDLVWRRGALSSAERIMAFIVGATRVMPTERRADGGLLVKITLGRRDWADLTSTTVETICRTLADLSRLDLVHQLKPGHYLIRNFEALMQMVSMDPVSENEWRDSVGQRDGAGLPALPSG
ncbi:MAG: Crp/Fnr family transcriptional regulator [Paracoccus sp. (in: a-proteobacteria)]